MFIKHTASKSMYLANIFQYLQAYKLKKVWYLLRSFNQRVFMFQLPQLQLKGQVITSKENKFISQTFHQVL